MSRFASYLLVLALMFTSCAVRYQSSTFSPDRSSLNYSDKNTWAVLPEHTPKVLDTFAVEKDKKPVSKIHFIFMKSLIRPSSIKLPLGLA